MKIIEGASDPVTGKHITVTDLLSSYSVKRQEIVKLQNYLHIKFNSEA